MFITKEFETQDFPRIQASRSVTLRLPLERKALSKEASQEALWQGTLGGKKPSLCAALQCHSLPAVRACSALPTWVLQNHSPCQVRTFHYVHLDLQCLKEGKKEKEKNFFLCYVSHYRLETDTETSEHLWKLWVSRLVTGWECQGVCAPVHHVYIGVSDGAWDNGPLSVLHCSAIRYSVS